MIDTNNKFISLNFLLISIYLYLIFFISVNLRRVYKYQKKIRNRKKDEIR